MSKPSATHVYYFCDESSYVKDEFMAVAGLAVPDFELAPITRDLADLKAAAGGPSEVKWSTVKKRRVSSHKLYVDYFHEAVEAKRVHFHIRFAPFSEYDHKASGPNQRADTTSKMHYQLLLHRALRFYGKHYKLHIRPDNGDCTAALAAQADNLHTWGYHHYRTEPGCIATIEPRDSCREPLLQLLDVPLGAMTALRNRRELTGAKRELADYVSNKWPTLNLARNTGPNAMALSIWNVVPKGPPKRGPWS